MECTLGKTIQLKNFGITLYHEVLSVGAEGAKMVEYFVIRPASNNWESRIYEFTDMFSFIKLLLKEDRKDALLMYLYNLEIINTIPDMCYHNAVMIQSVYASNPLLLEEGYDDGSSSHAAMAECEKSLRETWVAAYKREREELDRIASDVGDDDMDIAADVAAQMF